MRAKRVQDRNRRIAIDQVLTGNFADSDLSATRNYSISVQGSPEVCSNVVQGTSAELSKCIPGASKFSSSSSEPESTTEESSSRRISSKRKHNYETDVPHVPSKEHQKPSGEHSQTISSSSSSSDSDILAAESN